VLCACIDIGSNTTRLLVAEPDDGRLREVLQQRAFTRIGRDLKADGRIGKAKLAEVAEVVATQRRLADELGAQSIRAVATAAIRDAANHADLLKAVRKTCGIEVAVLSAEEEARLAFVGATKMIGHPVEGDIGVVDVGGGSSELVVGTLRDGVSWTASFRIGSGFLADAYLHGDPPGIAELHALREHIQGVFEGLDAPQPDHAVAVGGSATSLRRLIGAVLEHETLERAIRILSSTPIAEVARGFELDPERVRLLPAGILILEAASNCLGRPLQIGRGGLREGVILELLAGRDISAAA
jgi:exopolyphosphatase/guanosine-5'-triphosphate,3'-diphosphate pyrophosphatase